MSITDDRRIEELERLAQSLTTRVERLEGAGEGERRAGAGAPRPPRAFQPSSLPTVSLGTAPESRSNDHAPDRDSHQRLEDLEAMTAALPTFC